MKGIPAQIYLFFFLNVKIYTARIDRHTKKDYMRMLSKGKCENKRKNATGGERRWQMVNEL